LKQTRTRLEGGLRTKRLFHRKNEPGHPLISIITVVRNGEKYLEETIKSVISQTYANVEYILIDGSSTDKTLDIIKKYEDTIAFWMSEPDKGIYDAMNKGIDLSTGEWVYFLGSDDKLDNLYTIDNINKFLNEEFSIVFGNIKYTNNKIVKSKFSLKTLLHNTIHHQSAFYNKELFKNWRYDYSLKLISDYELNLKIYLNKNRFVYLNKIIAICNNEGESRSLLKRAFDETNLIRGKYLNLEYNYILSIIYYFKYKVTNAL
jgi:putative colanic acid biosynthesis glycosyltransferase